MSCLLLLLNVKVFVSFVKLLFLNLLLPRMLPLQGIVMVFFFYQRKKLKNFFNNLSSRVCLTTDTWTSGQNLSYMCLIAYFIDDDWKLHKRIINFCPVAGHSGELIGKSVEKCLLEWNLKRVMTVRVDNASSNDMSIKYLKKIFNLWDGCVLNYEFLHMRCAAHILNLVVKYGLKDVNVSVLKVQATVKYVRSSPSRLQKFKSCVVEENITCKGLVCLDIETRWNSTYLMLKTALVFMKAFKNMKTKLSPYTKELIKQPVGGAPDDEDWNKIQSFLPLLEIFYNATLKLSGSRYVTGNTFVEEIYDIGYTIYDCDSDPNDDVKNMTKQMKLKFDKYWANVHKIKILMFIALILDPRNKLKYTEHIVRNSYDVSNSYILCQRIQDTLNSLYDCYAQKVGSSSSNIASTNQSEKGGKEQKKGSNNVSRLRDSFVREIGNDSSSKGMTELENYLGDKLEPSDEDFDILAW
ncbi:zinc finger BED domain-containing protein RICESLEEPER 2-like [Chenopodium quinoa]|uniref:zinc finger BED domain-containing protein RICESLEEPER 2-like n=1 Tax=Chenopodium quinoa TaxID=63459 RepID=UPI000B786F8F|nr:zinc finger BED domain-containing protein RICESLEEPER 2-like [Chenopodium quinoa]XP_021762460.1 zinc finger BED domain-containing protein RICESLEEPER 2-like [Chenopodium quinoa]